MVHVGEADGWVGVGDDEGAAGLGGVCGGGGGKNGFEVEVGEGDVGAVGEAVDDVGGPSGE